MIKQHLKKIKFLVKIRKKYKIDREFRNDKRFFIKNYLESTENINTKKYDILLIVHGLEKATLNKNPRRFGVEKVKRLINNLKYMEDNDKKLDYEYFLGVTCLKKYCEFYEKQQWIDADEYIIVKSFLNSLSNLSDFSIPFGKNVIKLEDIMSSVNNINYKDIVNSRHSIRNFSEKKLDKETIDDVISSVIHTPSACNRQMCKIYFISGKNMKEKVKDYAMGLGNFELKNINYFLITYDMNSMYFEGERNQGYFNSGLLAMNFVNSLHVHGIGSCFIESGNTFAEEEKLKEELGLPKSERIAVIITAGYYKNENEVLFSKRKKIEDIYREI